MKKGLSQLIIGIFILILASAIGITYYTSKKEIQSLVTTTTTITPQTTTIPQTTTSTLLITTTTLISETTTVLKECQESGGIGYTVDEGTCIAMCKQSGHLTGRCEYGYPTYPNSCCCFCSGEAVTTTTTIPTTTTIIGTTTTIVYVGPLNLKLFTDKNTYSQGDLVTIFGNVTDGNGNPIQGEFVSIEVKDPRENTHFLDIATTSDDGSYTSSFRLHSLATKGTYNVYATCIEPKVVQTSFDVI